MQGIGPLTSKFLAELADPPHRLIAQDGDCSPIFKEQMHASEQTPVQAMLNMVLTAAANLERSDDKEAALVAMASQMEKAAREV